MSYEYGFALTNQTNNTEQIVPNPGLSALIGFISLFTLTGNTMVIVSVLLFRKLRKIPNMFVVSLATADLIMGGVVLPLGSHYVVGSKWLLGTFWCEFWTSIDILSVTASICTLCAISLDRFVAITKPFSYSKKMTRHRACLIIAFIWIVSATIAFIPINLGWWKTEDLDDASCYNNPHCCEFRINKTYAVTSSLVSFYIPLTVMVFTYSIVFKIAIHKRGIIRNRRGMFRKTSESGNRPLLWSRGEYKAVFTMGIIMGTFVACWLPFFIANITQVFCHRCISPNTFQILNWFGYANSCFNPIIYCHSKEFRQAYKRILLCSLCKHGYQQTARTSLSVSYKSSSKQPSGTSKYSTMKQIKNCLLSSSNTSRRNTGQYSPKSSRFHKSASNELLRPTNVIVRASSLQKNGSVIYGFKSSRSEFELSSIILSNSSSKKLTSSDHEISVSFTKLKHPQSV